MGPDGNDDQSVDGWPDRDSLPQRPRSMWPSSDSGIETSSFGPMGTAEREVAFAQGLPSIAHNKRALVTLGIIVGGLVLFFLVGALISAL